MPYGRQDDPYYNEPPEANWEHGDPVPEGYEMHCYDGDGESGPCEPTFWIEPIEYRPCELCAATGLGLEAESPLRRVVKHETHLAHFDPTDVAVLECGHKVM